MSPIAERILTFLLCAGLLSAGALSGEVEDPQALVERAKSEALAIPAQAEALVALAWPTGGPADPRVAAAARAELVKFGNHALPAVRRAIKQADPLYRADAVATLIEARRHTRSGNPPDYHPGLEEAIWFGSIEARRIAMLEIYRYVYPPAVLSIIDAIEAHPELTLPGLRALGRMHDPRARFFVGRALDLGDVRTKRTAAEAFAGLGEAGLLALRKRSTAADREVRQAAVAALLPLAQPQDLTLLYEYIASRTEDDPSVVQRVRERTLELEALLEQQQQAEAASAEGSADEP